MTTNTMKALAKTKPTQGLWQIDAPVPEIGPDDVLIRINTTGICGTDIHVWNWDEWAAATVPIPMITGHEFAGEIVDMGRNVTGLSLGQRCSGEGHLVEADSRQSRAGKFHLDPGTRGIGVNEQGAFAEYLRLPAFNVVPLPDDIPDEILQDKASNNAVPPLYGALMKNEQDLHLLERLAFMHRRQQR